jgi:hypothetical protein
METNTIYASTGGIRTYLLLLDSEAIVYSTLSFLSDLGVW